MHIDITTLYKEYGPRLLMYANKILKDFHLAEEIVDDVMVLFKDKQEDFSSKDYAVSWLYICTRNKCLNIAKKQKGRKKKVITLSSWYIDEFLDEIKCVPDYYIVQCEVANEICKEIEKLTPQPRMIFELAYFENKNLDEISLIMGTQKQTIKNQLTSAIKQLRIKFNPSMLGHISYATHTAKKKPHAI